MRIEEACARSCGNPASWFYHEQWTCDSCYRAEEFAPGHWRERGAMHFLGACDDCDARYAIAMTLEQVESWYHRGVFGQDVYEAYTHMWATGAPRFGTVSPSWTQAPVIPEVVRLVAVMRRATTAHPRLEAA